MIAPVGSGAGRLPGIDHINQNSTMSHKDKKFPEPPKKQAEVKKVLVTPAMAENWLISNIGNRPLDEARMRGYVDQMNKGNWELSTDALGFDTSEKLINGQHRLWAVVYHGKPVWFFVATGLDPEAFNVIDTGKNRTTGDLLGIKGFRAPAAMGAIARFVMLNKKGKTLNLKDTKKAQAATNQEVLEFSEKHRQEIEEAYEVAEKTARKFRMGLVGREIGGLYWIFSEFSKADALKFFELYASGENMDAKHPIFTLRQKFIMNASSAKKYGLRDKLAWAIIAWNKFRSNSQMSQLRWNGETDDFPKPI
jgi:hypothetical protein